MGELGGVVRGRGLWVELEGGVRRFWRSVLVRWWLPLVGLVVGAMIGLLVSLGAGRQWKAQAEVYLGSPFVNDMAVVSSPTSLGLAATFVDGLSAVRHASEASGIPAARLGGNISAKPVLGLSGSQGQPAPLLRLAVTGSMAGETERAVEDLATLVVSQFQSYPHQKLTIASARLAQLQGQVGDISRRLTQALNAQAVLARSAADQQLVAEYAQITSSLTDQRSEIESDMTSWQTLIARTQGVEAPRIVSPARSATAVRPSRRSDIVRGAILGFLVGLLAASLWEPIARSLRTRAAT